MLKAAGVFFLLAIFCAVQGQLTLSSLSQTQYNALAALPDAPDFTLAGKAYYGKVQSVYDGDTVKLLIKIGQNFQRFDCRLDWIDTPQVKTGLVKPFGAEVRDILSKMILGKIVRVEAGQFDKYGRVLTAILAYTPAGELVNINNYLATHGMAKYYYGGTKQEFVQADYDYFIQNFRSTVWPVFINYPYQTAA